MSSSQVPWPMGPPSSSSEGVNSDPHAPRPAAAIPSPALRRNARRLKYTDSGVASRSGMRHPGGRMMFAMGPPTMPAEASTTHSER